MGMTLNAAHRRRLPYRPSRIDAIHHSSDAKFFVVRSAFGVCLRVPMKCRRDQVIDAGIGQQVTRELPYGELIEG